MSASVNRIFHKACGSLTEIEDASVHVVVTSPPYNLSYRRQKNKKFNIDGYGSFQDAVPEDEYQAQQVALLDELARVIASDGGVFYNHKDRRKKGHTISPHDWISKVTGLSVYQTIIWDRGSSHNVAPIRQPPTTEYIFWLSKSGHRPRFNKTCRRWGLVWPISPQAETKGIAHPAPFPLSIPLRCILMSAAKDGDLVLDPYVGSGTTAVAAAMLNLPFIGYEINSDYISLAQERVALAQAPWFQQGCAR